MRRLLNELNDNVGDSRHDRNYQRAKGDIERPSGQKPVSFGFSSICHSVFELGSRKEEHARRARKEEAGFASLSRHDSLDVLVGVLAEVRRVPHLLVTRKAVIWEKHRFGVLPCCQACSLAQRRLKRTGLAILITHPLL